MPSDTMVRVTTGEPAQRTSSPAPPCLLVIFGASGDLTRRLLLPALFNLGCDGLLPANFAILGTALEELSDEQFRERMTKAVQTFTTRKFDAGVWESFRPRLHYTRGEFGDSESYTRLATLIGHLDAQHHTAGNVLFYLAVPPVLFGPISDRLAQAGLTKKAGSWRRVVVEKPFGHDLASAIALNQELLAHWAEEQIFRMDHYLGKETVQNLLAFRFSNGVFEPLWNKSQVDHIQFTVSETVGVEGRGKYYDTSGVLRDMVQNHMLQMLAYLCMEPPASLQADAVRNEKAKLLSAVRVLRPEEVATHCVRGQYGPGKKADGSPAVGYRQEPDVNPQSSTETFAALKLFIDNWRWEGVPVYLRSGKSLWKRDTEIVVQFKRAPQVVFRETPATARLESNQLLFHIQPDQGIEFRFHAKTPGPTMDLQKVNMRFDYRESFEAARGTGYEVLLYNCMTGDATLFSRADLVESAWQIAQPILDAWAATPATDFPNYPAGTWGPKAAFDLIEEDGRRWVEVLNRDVLSRVPLLQQGDPVFLHNVAMMLQPVVSSPGEYIIRQGEMGREMYFLCRGQAEVIDGGGRQLKVYGEGDFFGELSLLFARPRAASVRAVSQCDLFVLDGADFHRALKSYPQFAECLQEMARTYQPAG